MIYYFERKKILEEEVKKLAQEYKEKFIYNSMGKIFLLTKDGRRIFFKKKEF